MPRPTFNTPIITYRFFIKDNSVKVSFPVEAYESSDDMLLCISNMGFEYDLYIDKDVEDGSQVFYEYSSETNSLYERTMMLFLHNCNLRWRVDLHKYN